MDACTGALCSGEGSPVHCRPGVCSPGAVPGARGRSLCRRLRLLNHGPSCAIAPQPQAEQRRREEPITGAALWIVFTGATPVPSRPDDAARTPPLPLSACATSIVQFSGPTAFGLDPSLSVQLVREECCSWNPGSKVKCTHRKKACGVGERATGTHDGRAGKTGCRGWTRACRGEGESGRRCARRARRRCGRQTCISKGEQASSRRCPAKTNDGACVTPRAV